MMSESIFSAHWYRVANLKPMLRENTAIARHVYRGQTWYVLQNRLNGRSHRFNAASYAFIGQMDGHRTVQQIWDNAGKRSGGVVPTQDETIRLLARLHDTDLVQSDILPALVERFRQAEDLPEKKWKQRVSNPLAVRFPLWDPDRFLAKWAFLTSFLFTRAALGVWLLIVVVAVIAAMMHRAELAASLADRLWLPDNLLMLWLIYPLVKIFHELGHAFAVKKWGGEVHETGILLLALTPIPYVDATSSAFFPEKQRRLAVVAAGVMVEMLLAAIALFVWLNVETGLISAAAYNVMLIGGISTLLFNGNPLMRYDGYYALADLIEIPNLSRRANGYLGYLVQRHLLGIESARSPVTAPGEAGWFLFYGPVSFCYRIAILVALVWLVSDRFFFAGIVIALWGAGVLLVVPAFRSVYRFLNNPQVRRRPLRPAAIGAGTVLALLLLLVILPLPLRTTTQGVVWLPEQSAVRAGTACEVVEVLAPAGQVVARNAPLIKGSDPFLEAELAVCRAWLDELYARYNALPMQDRVNRKIMLEEIERAKGDLGQVAEKMEKLLIRSPEQGNYVLIDERNLPGRFVRQGELLGYIVGQHRPTIRAVVRQSHIGLVRDRVTGVEVRLSENMSKPLRAQIVRSVPSAVQNLPAAALGAAGGGQIPVDPSDPDGLRAMESLFQLDLSLPEQVNDLHIGARVHVRFEHGHMPLALQWYRTVRQLFLSKFYA
jgi:putative peptide zinc metalloprotease protein